jgi:ATP-binding cassette, subfamily C, bacterial LapB
LNAVSFSMKPGERIGIIGKAGCGKSTLLRLIARLYEPEQGRLQLDHRDIRQFDPAFVRRVISYMPQDAQLIDGTLDDNLTLGLSHVDKAGFERISAVCGVHAFASRHPSGYSLQVGPGGQRLSGGERQCVSLARALMGNPRLLMLDEPTAALDNMLEARIIADLKNNLGDTGLIVATHRLPALDLVGRIIWIEDGRIAADGPKAEIFQKLGLAHNGQTQKAANG